MKPEQQRIAIAEICGVKMFGLKKRGMWYRPDARGYTCDARDAGRYSAEEAKEHEYLHGEPDEHVRIIPLPPPDYPNDLNACHEMEKALSDTNQNDQWSKYCVDLNRICCRIPCGGSNRLCGYTIHATAPQRCEAFLKTVGKWVVE